MQASFLGHARVASGGAGRGGDPGKNQAALLKANGRRFDNAAAVEQFIDAELEFPVRHSYGGNSSCMEIIGGDHYTVCDMGSGLRCFGQQVMRKHRPGQAANLQFFYVPCALGPHHGIPVFPARLYSRQYHPHSRRPFASPCSKKRSAASIPLRVFRCLGSIGGEHRVSSIWTPNAGTKSMACGSRRNCSPILEIPTAIASSRDGKAAGLLHRRRA